MTNFQCTIDKKRFLLLPKPRYPALQCGEYHFVDVELASNIMEKVYSIIGRSSPYNEEKMFNNFLNQAKSFNSEEYLYDLLCEHNLSLSQERNR